MVKCFGPGSASHRGRKITPANDGSCELSERALEEMRPHGFREWTDEDEKRRPTLTLSKKKNGGE